MLNMTDATTGEPHVKSVDIGYYNVGQFGYHTGYFPGDEIGDFPIEILSNNKIRVGSGTGILGGRRFRNSGSLDISLSSGATGENRIDVIQLVHDQDEDGIESISTIIQKGTPTSGTPSGYSGGSTGPIPDISGKYMCSWIEVEFSGVNIIRAELHPDFTPIKSVKMLMGEVQDKVVSGSYKDVKIVVTNQTMSFTNGAAERNLSFITSAYGKKIINVFAQLVSATTTYIMSSTYSGDTVKVTAGKTDGSSYTGSPTVKLMLFLA